MQGAFNNLDEGALFRFIMGDVNIQLSAGVGRKSETIGSSIVLHDATYTGISLAPIIPIPLIIHELGHVFHNRIIDPATANSSDPKKYLVERMSDEGLKFENLTLYPSSKEEQRGYSLHTPSGVMPYNNPLDAKEAFADSFLFWVYDRYAGIPPVSSGLIEDTQDLGGFTKDDAGNLRRYVMTQWLADEVTILYGRSNPQIVHRAVENIIDGNPLSVTLSQSTANLKEHPSSANSIPSVLTYAGITNFSLAKISEGINLRAIGRITTGEGNWVLIEANGNVGWVPEGEINIPPAQILKTLDPEQVAAITGRNYTNEWIPQPAISGLGG